MTNEKAAGPNAMRVLFPGRTIELKLPGGMVTRATVFPIGVEQIEEYAGAIAAVSHSLLQVAGTIQGSDELRGRAMLGRALPYVLKYAIGLVRRCVKFENPDVTFSDMPHWLFAPIVQAWLLENFDDPSKWDPWTATWNAGAEMMAQASSGSTSPTPSQSSPATE